MINSRDCLSVTCGCYFYTELTNSNQTLSTLGVYSSVSDCHHPILLSPQGSWLHIRLCCLFWLFFSRDCRELLAMQGWDWDPISFGIELIARKWAVAGSDGGIRRASARIDETRDQGWNIHYIRSDRAGVDTSRLRSGLLFLCSATNVGSRPFIRSTASPRFPDSWFIFTTDRCLMSLLLRRELMNRYDWWICFIFPRKYLSWILALTWHLPDVPMGHVPGVTRVTCQY